MTRTLLPCTTAGGGVYASPRDAVGGALRVLAVALTLSPFALSQTTYVKSSSADAGDWFGHTVVVHGDEIAIGAIHEDGGTTGVGGDPDDDSAPNAGAVHLFRRTGADEWVESAYVKASNAEAGDNFGVGIALDGDTLVVGAHFEDGALGDPNSNTVSRSGAVYVFEREDGSWVQKAYLKARVPGPSDFFGVSVAVDGDLLAVGATGEASNGSSPHDDSLHLAGAVYVFERVGGTWQYLQMLKSPSPDADDRFGISIDLEGDTLAVGAYLEDGGKSGAAAEPDDDSATDAGAVFVFERTGGLFHAPAYVKPVVADAGDNFGFPVRLSGDTLVVGARRDDAGPAADPLDDSVVDSGAVHVFERQGSTWKQVAFLKASNPDPSDRFGYALDVWNDTIVVGAQWEHGGASGIGGNELDNSIPKAGAAYVFARTLGTWTQRAYVKAQNPGPNDRFARFVGIFGDTLVLGAHGEDGSATGGGADDSAFEAGAAYVLDLGYWTSFDGCARGAKAVLAPGGAARVGSTAIFDLTDAAIAFGSSVTYAGVLNVGPSGCGRMRAGFELLLAGQPAWKPISAEPVAGGRSRAKVAIPHLPSLVGTRFAVQSAVFDPNGRMVQVSNALEFVVQA